MPNNDGDDGDNSDDDEYDNNKYKSGKKVYCCVALGQSEQALVS